MIRDGLRCTLAACRALFLFPFYYCLLTLFALWPWSLGSPFVLVRPLGVLKVAPKASALRILLLRLELRLESLMQDGTKRSRPPSPRRLFRWLALPSLRTIPQCATLSRRESRRTGHQGLFKTWKLFFDSLVDSLRFGNGLVTRAWFDPERRHDAAFHIPNYYHILCSCLLLNRKSNPSAFWQRGEHGRQGMASAEEGHHDKLELFRACKKHGWPTPAVHRSFDSGEITEHEPILDRPLISKPATLAEGRGHFERWWPAPTTSASDRRYRSEDGRILSLRAILEQVARTSSETPYLLQELLTNHEDIRAISGADTLCTLRLPTCCFPDGRVEILPLSFFRMPTKRDLVFDNMARGGVAYRVDLETGRLDAGGKYGSYDEVTVQPTTSRYAPGFQVPYWKETMELCRTAHAVGFPSYPSVGWDIAITPTGPFLIEMNIRWATEHNIPNESFLGKTAYVDCILAHLQKYWPNNCALNIEPLN